MSVVPIRVCTWKRKGSKAFVSWLIPCPLWQQRFGLVCGHADTSGAAAEQHWLLDRDGGDCGCLQTIPCGDPKSAALKENVPE